MTKGYDLAVIGAGIVGLGAALAAHRQGKSVVVLDSGALATGASIRNFGFVTVTGQKAGAHWARARRSRDLWAEIAPLAGIAVLQHGLVIPAYRPEAADVLHAFARTEMGEGCRLITAAEAQSYLPPLLTQGLTAVLHSPHELRVESREAIPLLTGWLQAQGVDFRWRTTALEVTDTGVTTSTGPIRAEAVIACPGDNLATLFPSVIARHEVKICSLQMLRVAAPGMPRLKTALMSDHSLARYEGFTGLTESAALAARLDAEAAEIRAAGIHLIVVQSADGSMVVGDSHVYGDAPAAFASGRFDDLILRTFDEALDLPGRHVTERWTGTYASAGRTVMVERPAPNARLVIVTGGTGASTGLALGEQVIADLFNPSMEITEALA